MTFVAVSWPAHAGHPAVRHRPGGGTFQMSLFVQGVSTGAALRMGGPRARAMTGVVLRGGVDQ